MARKSEVNEKTLLAAVIASPESDEPRLDYARWMEANGQPELAEFIRIQCDLAKLPNDDPRSRVLREREAAVSQRKAWLRRLPVWARDSCSTRCRRGFPEVIDSDADKFVQGARRLRCRTPVSDVRLSHARDVRALAACPELAGVRNLNLSRNDWGDEEAALFAESPHLGGVVSLSLADNNIGALGLQALVANPNLVGLRHLDLSGNTITDAAAEVLAGAPCLGGLSRLILDVSPTAEATMTDDGVSALATSPNLVRLTHLSLQDHPFARRGMAHLASSPGLSGLVSLGLARCCLGPPEAALLGNATHLQRLRHLDLWGNHLGDEGAALLAQGSGLWSLDELALGDNDVGDRGAMGLAAATWLQFLRTLHLSYNGVGAAGVVALLRSPGLRGLVSLDLWHNCLTDGLVNVVVEPGLARLTHLRIGGECLSLRDIEALSGCRHLVNLVHLRLGGVGSSGGVSGLLRVIPHELRPKEDWVMFRLLGKRPYEGARVPPYARYLMDLAQGLVQPWEEPAAPAYLPRLEYLTLGYVPYSDRDEDVSPWSDLQGYVCWRTRGGWEESPTNVLRERVPWRPMPTE
jgi:uncharacterized protein (TIGR02996 family)